MESGGCAQFWAELICVMVCGLRESLVDQGRDLSGLERVAFNFLNHFQVKTFFFCFFTHNAHAKHLIFRPKSNQNIPNHCTTWTLGNFSRAWIVFTNQIPFCLLRIRSVTCYFLVNNLYFITYSTRTVQPQRKKFTWNYLIVNFPRNSPAFWLFLRIKFAFGLNPIAC